MKNKKENLNLDFYHQNTDFRNRVMVAEKENSIFPKDASVRIWYNVQTNDYLPHWHDAMEVIIPIENYYDVEIDNKPHHVLPGEILMISPRKMHHLHAPKSGARFVCLFNVDFFSQVKDYTGMLFVKDSCIHITPETYAPVYSEIYDLFTQIWNEYFQNTEFYEFAIYANLLQAFTLLTRCQLNQIHLFTESSPNKRRDYFARLNGVLEYIDSHYTEDLTLDEVADYSGFSKFHFTRLFKEYMNSTFYDYLIGRRIKASEILLSQQDLSITDVALQAGFSSISTFNRTFKAKKGCTPGEYRALFRKNKYGSHENNLAIEDQVATRII